MSVSVVGHDIIEAVIELFAFSSLSFGKELLGSTSCGLPALPHSPISRCNTSIFK